ncbi:MAG: hypothetical protein WD771_06390 [Gemmatimonadaceae bacterium]
MNVSFAQLCDYATISREGKLSVMGMFDQIASAQVPVVHPLMYLVFQIELNSAELGKKLKVRIELQSADGAKLGGTDATFRVDGPVRRGTTPKIPQVVPLIGLQFPTLGGYQFAIWINDDLKKVVGFDLLELTSAGPKR